LNHHDAYYFEKADMTIIVSRIKNTVATWRMAVRDGLLEVKVTNAAKRMNV
jgi:hypothetical protein